MLKSGATIKLTLDLAATSFDELTTAILEYLGKTLDRTALDRSMLIDVTSASLLQSKIGFKSMSEPAQLKAFAPSKGIDAIIDEAFSEMDLRFTLRMQEFVLGLSDHSPSKLPAATTVSNTINIGTNSGNVQQGVVGSTQVQIVELDASAINSALDQFEDALGAIPEAELAKMRPDLIALRAQASKAVLAEVAIKETGKSLRSIAEGVAGNLATPAFLAACSVLWATLGIG